MAEDLIIQIDEEFQGICPVLTAEERRLLCEDIVENGVRDPLVVWRSGDSLVLLDGHNRYQIALEHGIRFETADAPESVQTREAALGWIIKNQLGRRNLTREQASYLRGLRYKREKQPHGGDRKSSDQNEHLKTAGRLAAEYNVGQSTIRRDGEYAEAIDRIAQVSPTAKDLILNRTVRTTAEAVQRLSKRPVEEIHSVLDKVVSREATGISDAQRRLEREETARLASVTELPSGKYRTIVIDPPWSARDFVNKGHNAMGKGDPSYATMSVDEIAALPISELAEPADCHLYLWTINATWKLALELLDTWGFRYITTLTWCKEGIGVGGYFRNNTEHILFAVNGSRQLARADVGTWFATKRAGKHSTKPDEFYEIVESCSPGLLFVQ